MDDKDKQIEMLTKEVDELKSKLSRGMLFEQWVDVHIRDGIKVSVIVGDRILRRLQPLSQDRYNIQFLASDGQGKEGIEPQTPISIRKQAIDVYFPG